MENTESVKVDTIDNVQNNTRSEKLAPLKPITMGSFENPSSRKQNQNDDTYEDEPNNKFSRGSEFMYSPEAGADRLSKLSQSMLDEIRKLGYDTIFRKFVDELNSDLQSQNIQKESFEDFESKWHRIVNTICNQFYRKNFGTPYEQRGRSSTRFGQNSSPNMSSELTTFIQETPVLQIIQVFIDMLQQDGNYNGKQNVDEEQIRYSRFMYRSFVTLYHKCNGTWKPQNNSENRGGNSRSNKYQRNSNRYPRNMPNRSSKSYGRTASSGRKYSQVDDETVTDTKNTYRPKPRGSYRFNKSSNFTREPERFQNSRNSSGHGRMN
ncbi:hypothetical protein HIRU_S381 [Hirudovirus strain Sangsue]|nr:hypothetical protein HIRU_S381 [Hirudovirus strain Sangsue]